MSQSKYNQQLPQKIIFISDEEDGKSSILQKIILLGDTKGGKTSILRRFVNNLFLDTSYKPSIGCDFLSRDVQVDGVTTIKQQIWDTAGQESYQSFTTSFYRNSNAFILVLDGTQPINTSRKNDIRDVLKHLGENVPIYVAVNKNDHKDFKTLDKKQVKRIFYENNIELKEEHIFFCSAKTGNGIEVLFEAIARDFVQNTSDLAINPPRFHLSRAETTINSFLQFSSTLALFFSRLWEKHKLWLVGNGVILLGAVAFFALAAFAVGSFLTFGILPSAFIGSGIIVGGALVLWNAGYGIYIRYYQDLLPQIKLASFYTTEACLQDVKTVSHSVGIVDEDELNAVFLWVGEEGVVKNNLVKEITSIHMTEERVGSPKFTVNLRKGEYFQPPLIANGEITLKSDPNPFLVDEAVYIVFDLNSVDSFTPSLFGKLFSQPPSLTERLKDTMLDEAARRSSGSRLKDRCFTDFHAAKKKFNEQITLSGADNLIMIKITFSSGDYEIVFPRHEESCAFKDSSKAMQMLITDALESVGKPLPKSISSLEMR